MAPFFKDNEAECISLICSNKLAKICFYCIWFAIQCVYSCMYSVFSVFLIFMYGIYQKHHTVHPFNNVGPVLRSCDQRMLSNRLVHQLAVILTVP